MSRENSPWLEQPRDVLALRLARRCDLAQLLAGGLARFVLHRLGQLHVGRIVGLGAEGDGILAGVGQDVELVRPGAADGAGIGGDRAKAQPEPREDADIGVVHVAVLALQVLDGFELIQWIRGTPRTRHLPVIVVTSLAGEDDRRRGLDEGHQAAELASDLFDLVGAVLVALFEQVRGSLASLGQPLVGEGTGLDLAQHPLHLGTGLVGDDAIASGVVAVLGSVGDRVTHPRQTPFIEEVDDQLQLVEGLEVRRLGLVAGLDEGFE